MVRLALTASKVFLWVEPSGRVHWVIPREGNDAIAGADFSSSEAVGEARRTGHPAVARSTPPAMAAAGSHVEIAVPVRDGERLAGFFVGIFSVVELYNTVLSSPDAAPGWGLSALEGAREVYRRGSPDKWVAEEDIEGFVVPARLRVAPRPEVLARVEGGLPRVVWATGLAIALPFSASAALAQAAVRRADQARASEQRYRHFFEANLAGAIVTDPEGRLLDANPAALRMFGLDSVAAFGGRRMSALYARPEQRDEMLAQVAEKGQVDQIEMNLRTADRRPLHVLANAVGQRGLGGRLVEIHSYLFDIADKKRIETQPRQAQKMDAIGRLAGGVAHDFNNLLGVITGYGELLERDLTRDHPGRRRLREIQRAAESAAAHTRQLLAFSRQQALEMRVLDLNEIVPDAERMLRRVIGEDVALVTTLAPDLGRVRADPGQIEQVIMNLAINARDAMPKGGRLMIETANVDLDERCVATHPGVKSGPHVMLAVSDTGHGMDADALAHMFEPFFTTKEKGKAPALASRPSTASFNRVGSVNVYSEPGQGTSFKVYLPRVDEEAAGAAIAGEAMPPRGTETILLVEDSDSLREMIREVLEAYYVICRTQADGAC